MTLWPGNASYFLWLLTRECFFIFPKTFWPGILFHIFCDFLSWACYCIFSKTFWPGNVTSYLLRLPAGWSVRSVNAIIVWSAVINDVLTTALHWIMKNWIYWWNAQLLYMSLPNNWVHIYISNWVTFQTPCILIHTNRQGHRHTYVCMYLYVCVHM